MATPSLPALSAYRQILRATRVAFQSSSIPCFALCATPYRSCHRNESLTYFLDDNRVLLAARAEARQQFDQNRRVGIDTGMQINQAIEVANILRHNIVQGSREAGNENAKWGMYSPGWTRWKYLY